jgi:hypothetical protein
MPDSVGAAARNGRLSPRSLRILTPVLALLALAALPGVAGATSIRWSKAVRVEPSRNGGVDAVSCPSTKLCVAVDASGFVITTTTPTASRHVWSRTARIDSTSLTGVSCPSTRLCVAVDDAGSVLTSTNPTGGSRAWSRGARVDSTTGADGGPAGLLGISCPNTHLCVAVDGSQAGNVVTSTDPTGGARAWSLTAVGGPLTSVSCRSASLCVAAGAQHIYSTDPTGGTTAWHATGPQAGGGVLSAIDCPSLGLCVGVGYGNTSTGLVTMATNPRGGASAWKTVSIQDSPPDPGEGLLDAVGCGRRLCVALDGADNAYTASSPNSGTWSGPSPIRRNSVSQASAISCVSTLCLAVDSAGVSTAGTIR